MSIPESLSDLVAKKVVTILNSERRVNPSAPTMEIPAVSELESEPLIDVFDLIPAVIWSIQTVSAMFQFELTTSEESAIAATFVKLSIHEKRTFTSADVVLLQKKSFHVLNEVMAYRASKWNTQEFPITTLMKAMGTVTEELPETKRLKTPDDSVGNDTAPSRADVFVAEDLDEEVTEASGDDFRATTISKAVKQASTLS